MYWVDLWNAAQTPESLIFKESQDLAANIIVTVAKRNNKAGIYDDIPAGWGVMIACMLLCAFGYRRLVWVLSLLDQVREDSGGGIRIDHFYSVMDFVLAMRRLVHNRIWEAIASW